MTNRTSFILEGPQEELERIIELFESEELQELPNLKILDVSMISTEQIEADWVKSEIRIAEWTKKSLQAFSQFWQQLEIYNLVIQPQLPPELERSLIGLRDNPESRISQSQLGDSDKKQWIIYAKKLDVLPAILAVWLKPNFKDFDLLIQLYAREEQNYLPNGVELGFYSNDELTETVLTGGSHNAIQSDVYTVEREEKLEVKIVYKNFQFVQDLQNLLV